MSYAVTRGLMAPTVCRASSRDLALVFLQVVLVLSVVFSEESVDDAARTTKVAGARKQVGSGRPTVVGGEGSSLLQF